MGLDPPPRSVVHTTRAHPRGPTSELMSIATVENEKEGGPKETKSSYPQRGRRRRLPFLLSAGNPPETPGRIESRSRCHPRQGTCGRERIYGPQVPR